MIVQGIIDNFEAGCSAEQIAREIYDLDLELVRRILEFARSTTYRLDPDNPRRLTPEEQRELDETPIDYSDIPPLFSDAWMTALLLAMVIEHCAGHSPEKARQLKAGQLTDFSPDPSPGEWLNSYNIPANAEAMLELHDGGEIEITEQDGAHIVAKITPEGRALLDWLRAERERDRERAAKPDRRS